MANVLLRNQKERVTIYTFTFLSNKYEQKHVHVEAHHKLSPSATAD